MRAAGSLIVVLVSMLAADAASAQLGGLLDRAKRKAREAAAEVRDVRVQAEEAVDVEGRAAAEADRVEREVERQTDVEGRARTAVEGTEPVREIRAVEREASDVAAADERAAAAARAEVSRAEYELERQTDVEARGRAALEQTEPAVAVREAERDVRTIATTDERVGAELERERREIERAIEDITTLQ